MASTSEISGRAHLRSLCLGWRRGAGIIFAILSVLFLLGTGAARRAQAQVESVLHSFTASEGTDPSAGLVMDSAGNLYGTTRVGGSSSYGTVFKLDTSGTLTVLHDFSGGSDGSDPFADLLMDSSGNLYGTTLYGGSALYGIVFELVYNSSNSSYTERVLHSFGPIGTGGGVYPNGGLIMDSSGNLYGTTSAGGPLGCGVVFELSPPATSGGSWTEQTLYEFTGGTSDGKSPNGGLIMDSSGNLYGTTVIGGPANGTVFEVSPPATSGGSWTENVLYSFKGVPSDGNFPVAGLIMDSSGNLYGTTRDGGASPTCVNAGCGTVFELSPPATSGGNWTENLLHSFSIFDGAGPSAGLIMDSSGNLYGTTEVGGSGGVGTVFEVSPPATMGGSWTENVLYSFKGVPTDGYRPVGGLITGSSGNLYGTTTSGGSIGGGTVFGIAPINLSASSLNFGLVAVGTTSAVQDVTATNIGSVQLSNSPASLSGANAADFAITSNTCSSAVAPGGACTVSVTFTPSNTTMETASLDLFLSGMTQIVSLVGFGGSTTVSLSPTSLTFSSQVVGTISSAQTVTLTNNGTVPLTVTSVGITGDFDIASNNCSTVAANGTCKVGVTFKPMAAGQRTGWLSFADNATSSPPPVSLSGSGADYTMAVTNAAQSVSPGGTATYSLQLTPEGGFNQSVSLACSGAPKGAACAVTPASVSLDGTNNASFSVKVTTTAASMLGPGPGNLTPPPSGSLPLGVLLAIAGVLGLLATVRFSPRRGRIWRLGPIATLALLVTLWAACGGGGSSSPSTSTATNPNATPVGTYTLTVTGTSGSLSHSAQLTLKVQ